MRSHGENILFTFNKHIHIKILHLFLIPPMHHHDIYFLRLHYNFFLQFCSKKFNFFINYFSFKTIEISSTCISITFTSIHNFFVNHQQVSHNFLINNLIICQMFCDDWFSSSLRSKTDMLYDVVKTRCGCVPNIYILYIGVMSFSRLPGDFF